MSLRSTIAANSWLGYQATGNWEQFQTIPFDYTSVGDVSGNGLYFVIKKESSNEFDIYVLTQEFTIQQTINPSLGLLKDLSINYDGDYIAAGFTDATGGFVEIYKRTGSSWALQTTLTPSDAPQEDFGTSVALTSSADRIAIGNPETTIGNQYGSFYTFTRSGSTWTQETKKQLTTLVSYDRLGTSIDIDGAGDTIVVGAPSVFSTTGTTGKVVTFTRSGSTWTQQQIITRPTGATGRDWGGYVTISSNSLYLAGSLLITRGLGVFSYSGGTWSQLNYFISPYNNNNYFYPGGIDFSENADYMFTAGDAGVLGPAKGFTYTKQTTFSLSEILNLKQLTVNNPNFPRVIGTNATGSLLVIIGFVNPDPNELYILRRV